MRFDTTPEASDLASEEALEAISPFAEAGSPGHSTIAPLGYAPWAEALSPFAGSEASFEWEDEDFEDTLHELHDEGFHEAVALLAEETEQAVTDRFSGEASMYAGERRRFAQTYLSGVQFEAEQYLDRLAEGIGRIDAAAFSPDQLGEALDQFDPTTADLTPAGEEFIGKLVKKAKKAVKVVAGAAKQVGKLAAPLLAPMLKQLRKLIRPLLDRVLSLAIGRLPTPLQPIARTLADKIAGKTTPAGEMEGEGMAPATTTDAEALADSFDLRLAETIAGSGAADFESEDFAASGDEAFAESDELERLSEARGAMIDQFRNARANSDMTPVIEQFVPALLMALRTGIRLVGRPKVVSFLSGYLAKMVSRWIDPAQAKPLANAIVDTGLRMISLEAEADTPSSEAAQVALAGVIEDSIRRFAENEEYVFDHDDLMQVAAADAFGEAVATHFPQEHLREELQLAPSLGGVFVTRQPRSARAYAKYNRSPEVEISSRAADAIPSFGGTSLGARVRASGGRFPLRARIHVYQAKPGSTVASMLRHDRRKGAAGALAHPFTPTAAGILVREPGLGVKVPRRFMRNHQRIAAGQRIFVLEPLTGLPATQAPPAPGRAWIAVKPSKGAITLGFYLSEPEAQQVAGALRKGQGYGELLRRLLAEFRATQRASREAEGGDEALFEDGESFEDFAARAGGFLPHGFKAVLRQRIAAWALPALSTWLRQNSEAFLRAAADPRPGVTLRVRLAGVPGLSRSVGAMPSLATFTNALRGKPATTVLVRPGKGA